MNKPRNILIAITGASGSIYAKLLIEKLNELSDQFSSLAVIFSDTAKSVWKHELGDAKLPDGVNQYANNDFWTAPASGSGKYDTMVVVPCTMGTLGRIASGHADDLIARAADVMLKEKRKLIIVPRETPLNLIHIRNMETLMLAGARLIPAVPSFYSKPETVEDVAMTVVERIISNIGLDYKGYSWGS